MRYVLPAPLVRLLLAAAFLLSSSAAIPAQNFADNAPSHSRPSDDQSNRPQSGFVLKKTVRRVILDVVVTDKQGIAVPGLSRKDFSVAESGKSQHVLSFEEHDFRASVEDLPKLPPLPANTFVNLPSESERGPLYVIVYDALNIWFDDQSRARQQLIDFLNSKPPGTRFALFVASDGFHLAQGFTTDPSELLAVFDTHRQRPGHIPWFFLNGRNYGASDPGLAIEELAFVAHYLEGLPGRKNLIWMASRMPFRLPLAGPVGAALGSIDGDFSDNYQDEMKEAVNALTAAQVAVYPVDVHGLDAAVSGIDALADEIAADTGGRAYYNTNDLKSALADATESGSSYYELSYSPSDQNNDGRLRKIQVDLSGRFAKNGYRLAYRRGYYATDRDEPGQKDKLLAEIPEHPFASKQNDPLVAHLEHGAPMTHELLFRAHLSPAGAPAMGTPEQMANLIDQASYLRARRRNKPVKLPRPIPLQTYTIDYTVLDRALLSKAKTPTQPVIEFAAAAYDSEGKLLNGTVQPATQMPRSSSSNTNAKALYRVQQTLDVPTNAAWLRVAVRDLSTSNVGALEIPLPLTADPTH